jgi:[ribosomal protein S18]-alanine N-acetyltransferase
MTIQIIETTDNHLDQIWAIEQQAHSHPWTEGSIRNLKSRCASNRVMLEGDEVLGYYYAQDVVGEMTLMNIAIKPSEQGRGLGKQLINYFLALCEKNNNESAWLEVRESNQNAIYLYQSAGFNEVDRRSNYYPSKNGKEDAIIMSYYFL